MQQEQDWRDREDRACRKMPVDDFFPVGRSGSPGYVATERAALAACGRCPVVVECLAWAVEHRVLDGVWGGTGEKARRKLISDAGRKARAAKEDDEGGRQKRQGGGEMVAGVGAQAHPQ